MSLIRGKYRWPEGPITGDEFATFVLDHEDDVGPCELVAGRIVPVSRPPFPHGFLQVHLGAELVAFSKRCLCCWIATDIGVYTRRRPDTIRGPDILAVSRTRLPSSDFDKVWLDVVPELVVEVLSTSDRWKTIQKKTIEYQRLGVECIWLLDPKHRNVTEYCGDRIARYQERDTLVGKGLLEGFSLPLEELFKP